MLVLSRKADEQIVIGDDIVITVIRIERNTGQVKIGVEAPKDVTVHRREVYERIRNEERQ